MRTVPLLAVALAGCYTFSPVESVPSPGETVRANLTGPGALRLSEITGEPTQQVVGDVARVTDEQAQLLVMLGSRPMDYEPSWDLRDTLRIPRQDIDSFDRRELSTLRTTLTVVGVAGGMGYLLYRTLSGRGGGSDGDGQGDDGPMAMRIRILRLPSPF